MHLLYDRALCFPEHSLQILNTAWAFKPLVTANRRKFILDVYLLSSWVGANETHLVRLPVRLRRTAMHIYADSWKLTRFVTSPQKTGSEISDSFYFVNTGRKIHQIWRDNRYFDIIATLNAFFHGHNQAYIILTDNLQNGYCSVKICIKHCGLYKIFMVQMQMAGRGPLWGRRGPVWKEHKRKATWRMKELIWKWGG